MYLFLKKINIMVSEEELNDLNIFPLKSKAIKDEPTKKKFK
jgi:hypothetical protein